MYGNFSYGSAEYGKYMYGKQGKFPLSSRNLSILSMGY